MEVKEVKFSQQDTSQPGLEDNSECEEKHFLGHNQLVNPEHIPEDKSEIFQESQEVKGQTNKASAQESKFQSIPETKEPEFSQQDKFETVEEHKSVDTQNDDPEFVFVQKEEIIKQDQKVGIESFKENKFQTIPEDKEVEFSQKDISEPEQGNKFEEVKEHKLENDQTNNSGHIQDDKSKTFQDNQKMKQAVSNTPMQQILDEIIDKVKDISDAELKDVILFKIEAVKNMLIETSAKDPSPSAPPPPPPAPPPPAPRPTFQLKLIQKKGEGVELTVKKKNNQGQSDFVNDLKNALKRRFKTSLKKQDSIQSNLSS